MPNPKLLMVRRLRRGITSSSSLVYVSPIQNCAYPSHSPPPLHTWPARMLELLPCWYCFLQPYPCPYVLSSRDAGLNPSSLYTARQPPPWRKAYLICPLQTHFMPFFPFMPFLPFLPFPVCLCIGIISSSDIIISSVLGFFLLPPYFFLLTPFLLRLVLLAFAITVTPYTWKT